MRSVHITVVAIRRRLDWRFTMSVKVLRRSVHITVATIRRRLD